jgi:hypothetical protein
VVRSELTDSYASAFEGMEMETKDGETILTGRIIDQPHLYGILDRINGLGLELLSVQALPDEATQAPEELQSQSYNACVGLAGTRAIHPSAWKRNSAKFAGTEF